MSATSPTAAPITIDGGGPVGELLRAWRTKRRVSQLDLATKAEVSTRHLSFIETGRSKPSSDMVLHLAAHLDVPLRGRDELLVAAGFAPRFARGGIQSVELAPIRGLLDTILASYQSTPAIVVDRHWNVEAMNDAAGFFATLVDPDLLDPLNVMRLTLHPDGLAGHLVNRAAVSEHLLGRLRSQVDHTGDPVLADLLDELVRHTPADGLSPADTVAAQHPTDVLALPVHLRLDDQDLRFISTITTFGAPLDVSTSELAIEAFHPADPETAELLASLNRN